MNVIKPILMMKVALALLLSAFFMGQVPEAEATHRHGQWVPQGNDYYWQPHPSRYDSRYGRQYYRYDDDPDNYYYYRDRDDDDDVELDLPFVDVD